MRRNGWIKGICLAMVIVLILAISNFKASASRYVKYIKGSAVITDFKKFKKNVSLDPITITAKSSTTVKTNGLFKTSDVCMVYISGEDKNYSVKYSGDDEALVLTPNTILESGVYTLKILTTDGKRYSCKATVIGGRVIPITRLYLSIGGGDLIKVYPDDRKFFYPFYIYFTGESLNSNSQVPVIVETSNTGTVGTISRMELEQMNFLYNNAMIGSLVTIKAGGILVVPILPLDSYNGVTLTYPVGTGDFKDVTGGDFDKETYSKISQYIFLGDKDTNDGVYLEDGYDDAEREEVLSVLGKTMYPERWNNVRSIYEELDYPIQTVTYHDIAHSWSDDIINDITSFITLNQGDGFKAIIPHNAD